MKSKKPRIVIVSGSSSGIGKELCALYRAAGDTVIGLSRRGGDYGDIAVDVTDYAAVENAVNEIATRYGGIDTVIANAGGGRAVAAGRGAGANVAQLYGRAQPCAMRAEAHAGGWARGVCFVGMRAFRIAVPRDLLREQSGGQYGGVRAVHGTQKTRH